MAKDKTPSDKIRTFSVKSVGRLFRIMTGPGVPGGQNGRYQVRVTDLSNGISKSYSMSYEEMQRLNSWIVQDLYYRATGIDRRKPGEYETEH